MSVQEQFLAIVEKQFKKGLTLGLYENLQLDDKAVSEMNDFLEKEGFVKELFANTHKVIFSEESLNKLMKSVVDSQRIADECFSEADTTQEEFEMLVSKTQMRLFEDFNPELSKIVESSYSRQGLI